MTRLVPASLVVLLALTTAATAAPESLEAQISQVFAGLQHTQLTAVSGNTPQMLNGPERGPTSLTQTGTNATNLLSSPGTPVNGVLQVLDGRQVIVDTAVVNASHPLASLQQNGLNIADAASGETLSAIAQYIGNTGGQEIRNTAHIETSSGAVTQTGTNAANLLFATQSIDSASQQIAVGAVQEVDNYLALKAGGRATAVTQTGSNVGNALIADKVDNVTRIFAGNQIVNNTINFGSGTMPSQIHQSGLNVANYVSAGDIGNLTQISVGHQMINNSVVDDTLQSYTQNLDGGTLAQDSSSNFVNVIALTGGNEDNQSVHISQSAQFSQTTINGNSPSQVGNAVSISR